MNRKISPVASIVVILVAIGVIFGVMYTVSDRRPPHLPTGPGGGMSPAAPRRPGAMPGRAPAAPTEGKTGAAGGP